MDANVDERHLRALLGSAGKTIASLPGAKGVVAKMKLVKGPEDLAYILQGVDLGLAEPARQVIWRAAVDRDRWRETHAILMRSAEQQLIEKFHASS